MSTASSSRTVLIVEDEWAIADDLVRACREHGLSALPPVPDAAAALDAIRAQRVDFAAVDINLGGVISFDVAAELKKRAIPFLFLTGYEASVVPTDYARTVVLQKPNDAKTVVAEIRRQLRIAPEMGADGQPRSA